MLYQRTINVNVTFKLSIIHFVRTIQWEHHNTAIDGDMKSERHYTTNFFFFFFKRNLYEQNIKQGNQKGPYWLLIL